MADEEVQETPEQEKVETSDPQPTSTPDAPSGFEHAVPEIANASNPELAQGQAQAAEVGTTEQGGAANVEGDEGDSAEEASETEAEEKAEDAS